MDNTSTTQQYSEMQDVECPAASDRMLNHEESRCGIQANNETRLSVSEDDVNSNSEDCEDAGKLNLTWLTVKIRTGMFQCHFI